MVVTGASPPGPSQQPAEASLQAEIARDVIFRFGYAPSARYGHVSPATRGLVGYAPEEFYAHPSAGLRLIHPHDKDEGGCLDGG